jgi:hypothetical protein
MANVVVAPSRIHVLGVFAARDFRAGETILPIDDFREVDENHPLQAEAGEFEVYCDYLAAGQGGADASARTSYQLQLQSEHFCEDY